MNIETTFKDFLRRLSECTGEDVGPHEGVSAVYSSLFSAIFKTEPTRVHGCDGYWPLPEDMGGGQSFMLVEYKFGRELKRKVELAGVLAQCTYYIRKFVEGGAAVPKVVCAADENEAVLLSGEVLWKTVGGSSGYAHAPSSADRDEALMRALMDSNYIDNLFVFDMGANCDAEGFVQTIRNIACAGVDDVPIEVNGHNIDKVWTMFNEVVFGKGRGGAANERVSVFVHYITNHDDFIVDAKGGRFSLDGKTYKVSDPKRFNAFRRHFGYVRSVRRKEELRATCDRFIEDLNRRRKGEFYTPTAFVDYAHRMIGREFGENWRDEFVVWDCAWGTGNLTRDYRFKELYCSTLEQAELDIARSVNPEAVKFRFDFLNDSFEALPEGLQRAFREGRKVLFFINPPYASAGAGSGKGTNKVGMTKTLVNEQMVKEKIGKSVQNLYGQFLYRILKLKSVNPNINLAVFCPSLFLTGGSWSGFRKVFFKSFGYVSGVQFQASHFSDVATKWGIMFSMWDTNTQEKRVDFPCVCVDVDETGEIVALTGKTVYNVDGKETGADWVKAPVKGVKGEDAPQMKSALAWRENGQLCGLLAQNALGYYHNCSNNVEKGAQDVYIVSSCAAHAHGCSILPQNFDRVVANFAARKLIDCNWMNSKDEYMVPNVEDSRYAEYQKDSIVFSLFNTASNQSSLRGITYKDKVWDIRNEFFWMGRARVMDLADEAGFEELYNDAKRSGERFAFKRLRELELSPEAKDVLDRATHIVERTMEYRKDIHDAHPEWHLNAWDAGWYQVRRLASELPFLKDEMDGFKESFKALADKMRPMVYDLGFLKR